MNMVQVIKKCATDAFDALQPCDVLFGTVNEINPLCIECNEMLLDDEVLDVCEHLKYKECKFEYGLTEKTIVVNEGLDKGDKVVLVRQKGGERFVVFGKMV